MRVDTAVTSGGSSGRASATASGAQETDSQMTVEEGTSAEGGGVGTTDFEADSQATQINQSQQACIDPPSSAADGTTGSVSRQGVSPCVATPRSPSQSPVLMRQALGAGRTEGSDTSDEESPVLVRQRAGSCSASDNGSVGGDAASSGRGMVMVPSETAPLTRVIDANNLLKLIQIDTYLA